MNLKESFRYQSYLSTLMEDASASIRCRDHCLTVEKQHKRNAANADVSDMTETVEVEKFTSNDKVMEFMLALVEEREKLTKAINTAKAGLDFDIDAAVEANKFRQSFVGSVKSMLHYTGSEKTERGIGYKFNVAGDQTQYYYDINVVSKEAFDRDAAKAIARDTIMKADEVSAAIDAAMINTTVEYQPPFDVNDSFEDAMAVFLAQ